VPRDDRELRDRVPAVAYVEIGTADAGGRDTDRDLAGRGFAQVELLDRRHCSRAGHDGR
jgi:hypothetical protein